MWSGNSTALLVNRWPAARVVGVDTSKAMLQRARADWPAQEWIDADAVSFRPDRPPDLIFANALLQWVPDHGAVIPGLFEQLRTGGVLAIQMPRNFAEPSHVLMRKLGPPWDERLAGVRDASPVETPAFYYDRLATRARQIDIWQTTYEHVMPDAPSIVDWVTATGLRPYLDALNEAERIAYLEAYERAIDAAYPPQADGRRLFSFPRIFVVAVRA